MPREATCKYYDCGQGLLVVGRSLSKSQKSHIAAYHTDRPVTFNCKHTNRPITFNRQSVKDMDFVCYCGKTFTLNSSLQRHHQLCMVARDTVLNVLETKVQVDIPVPSQEEAVPLRSSDSSGGTIVSRVPTSAALVADPTTGQPLEEKMIERHQIFLKTFTEHTTAQHTKFMVSMTELHMTFLQAFTAAQVQQNTDLQSALAEQHHKAFEKQSAYLDIQRRTQEELLSEQNLILATVRNLLSTKRERSFALEVDEQALKRIQNDPAYIVRPT